MTTALLKLVVFWKALERVKKKKKKVEEKKLSYNREHTATIKILCRGSVARI